MTQPTEFLKRINAALALREIPDNEAALKQLEKAINLSPQDAYVHLLIGQTFQELEKNNDAEASFRQAITYQPDLTEAQQSLGLILIKNQKYQEAINILKPLADTDPGNEIIVQALATAYEEINEPILAIQVLKAAIALHNDRVPLLKHLADILSTTNDLEEAVQVIDQALSIDRSSSLLNLRGIFVALQQKELEAIPYFEEAIKIDQKNIPAFRNLAQAYLAEGDIENAIEVADRGLNLYPNSEKLLSIKAKILLNSDQIDEAIIIMEKLISDIEKRSKHIISYYITLLKADRLEQAFRILQEEYQTVSKQQRESFLVAIENAGVHLFEEGSDKASKQLYKQVLQVAPNQARSINNLGFILICERSWYDAQELLQRAEELGFSNPFLLKANQGYIALNLHEPQIAVKLFSKVLEDLENSSEKDESALLHVAYPWIDGLANNRGDDYPTRNVLIKTSILANLACAYHLIGEKEQAIKIAQQTIDGNLIESTGYRMLGCLHFIDGNYETAQHIWKKALDCQLSQQEDTIIQNWIDLVKNQT